MNFVERILSHLTNFPRRVSSGVVGELFINGVSIISTLPHLDGELSVDDSIKMQELLSSSSLPRDSLVVGSTITMIGSAFRINQLLENVFYCAFNPAGSSVTFQSGLSYINISLTSSALVCPLEGVSSIGTGCQISSDSETVTAAIPVFVNPINQVPVISFPEIDSSFTGVTTTSVTISAVVDFPSDLPVIYISDSDHLNALSNSDRISSKLSAKTGITTSFGSISLPPVTVMLSVVYGRISVKPSDSLGSSSGGSGVSEAISYLQGRGYLDKKVTIRGSIDKVNDALSRIEYVCQSTGGGNRVSQCRFGLVDTISILVNDEGFYGVGNTSSLYASSSVFVQLVER